MSYSVLCEKDTDDGIIYTVVTFGVKTTAFLQSHESTKCVLRKSLITKIIEPLNAAMFDITEDLMLELALRFNSCKLKKWNDYVGR